MLSVIRYHMPIGMVCERYTSLQLRVPVTGDVELLSH